MFCPNFFSQVVMSNQSTPLFQDEISLQICDACDQGFHLDCCDPPLAKPQKGKVQPSTCLLRNIFTVVFSMQGTNS